VHIVSSDSLRRHACFLKALDILVLPSVTILPVHASSSAACSSKPWAAGVAVIGSSSGAIPEVIGDAGIVVPNAMRPRLPTPLTASSPAPLNARHWSNALASRVPRSFAWPVVAEQTRDLFCARVAHRPPRHHAFAGGAARESRRRRAAPASSARTWSTRLIEREDEVLVVDNLTTGYRQNVNPAAHSPK